MPLLTLTYEGQEGVKDQYVAPGVETLRDRKV